MLGRKGTLRKYRISDKNRASQRKYRKSPKGKTSRRAVELKYNSANRRKRRAKGAVNHAVRRGELPRIKNLPCFACIEADAAGYHHPSYDRANWLRVVPLCRGCHSDVHEGKLPDQFPIIAVGRIVRQYEMLP